MKKLIAGIFMIMSLSASITSFAAETYYTDNSLTSDSAAGMKTVLVTNAATNEIIYANQASSDSAFTESTRFLLKENPADGEYTIKLGGNSTVTKTFYIGLEKTPTDIAMTKVSEITKLGDVYGVGYTVDAAIDDYILLVETADGVMGYELDMDLSGEGAIKLGVQINASTEAELQAIKGVYISTRAISEDTVSAEVNE